MVDYRDCRSARPDWTPWDRFVADAALEEDGFELVWGFSCQGIEFLGFCRFFVRSEKPFFAPSPATRFPERAEGVQVPKR